MHLVMIYELFWFSQWLEDEEVETEAWLGLGVKHLKVQNMKAELEKVSSEIGYGRFPNSLIKK